MVTNVSLDVFRSRALGYRHFDELPPNFDVDYKHRDKHVHCFGGGGYLSTTKL